MNDLLLGLGHNVGTEFDALKARVEELHAAANQWALTVPKIVTEEQARKAADFIDQVRAAEKALAAEKEREARPLIIQQAALRILYASQEDILTAIRTLLNPKQTAWLQRERRRLEDEAAAKAAEADRIARAAEAEREKLEAGKTRDPVGASVRAKTLEESAAQAQTAARQAAQAAERPRVAGDYGKRAHGLRTRWYAEVTDVVACFAHYVDSPAILDALTKLASAAARAGVREIPGAIVKSEETSA